MSQLQQIGRNGYCARKLGQESKFGQLLDPLADKILLVASYLGFYFLDYIPIVLTVIVVGRDVLILMLALVVLMCKASFAMKPLLISKINTCFQILHVILVLLHVPYIVLLISGITVAATTIISGFLYLRDLKTWYTSRGGANYAPHAID